MMNENIRLVVGLGNPGTPYQSTRHNAGRWFVDLFSNDLCASAPLESKFGYYKACLSPQGDKVYFFESKKYMNECGLSIAGFAKYYKIAAHQILVAYDEMDLPPGVIRLRRGGGCAGHNGLKDCIKHIKGDFYRLRIGVGRPLKGIDPANYVLSSPTYDEQNRINAIITDACHDARYVLEGSIELFMNKLHKINHGI